jgi:hypothetical protein
MSFFFLNRLNALALVATVVDAKVAAQLGTQRYRKCVGQIRRTVSCTQSYHRKDDICTANHLPHAPSGTKSLF